MPLAFASRERPTSAAGEGGVVAGGVHEGPPRENGHTPLDGRGGGDRVVGTATSGFALSTGPRWANPPVGGPVSVDVGGRGDAQGINLLRRVAGFLQRHHRCPVCESEVGESGKICIETRAVETDDLSRAWSVSVCEIQFMQNPMARALDGFRIVNCHIWSPYGKHAA